MPRWSQLAAIYALLGIAAGAVAMFWRGTPWAHPEPWLRLSPAAAHLYSALLGLTVGLGVAMSTRPLVARFEWARRLSDELRPVARQMSTAGIVAVALLSAAGEELLFRSVVQPAAGLWIQALLFGLAHQLPGRARWVWVSWAAVMGLVLGAMFQLTGSLLGPVLAHAAINGLNLRYLREHDPAPRRRPMGGLLDQRG
ncbi:MAG: CPBP family intramembrane metalloprotease [Myxococcales bacterium]|jgi:membrane protease YdiL (CAAX protease family)|nr:CPBP family intramembrane metalloprotease [Myxococcales bacterium]